jgi:hypothetical protein
VIFLLAGKTITESETGVPPVVSYSSGKVIKESETGVPPVVFSYDAARNMTRSARFINQYFENLDWPTASCCKSG